MTSRLNIRGREVGQLEKVCSEIIQRARAKEFKTKGPVRIPTKCLRITTRKSPCGEGTNTWDRFEMRIHKRIIDLYCPSTEVTDITKIKIEPGIDVNLTVWKN